MDTRESAEFEERHIPGAINIKLREVNASLLPQFQNADRVIAYCVKDFRGYEVARALQQIGVNNASIMQPYGIRGWMDWGLPVAGSHALVESEALQTLQQCASQPTGCLEG